MVHFFIGFVSKQGNGSVRALHRHPFYEIIITFTNTFLLITLENTVQKEAQRIRRSPIRYRRGFP